MSNKFAVYIAIGRVLSMLAVFVMPLVLTRFLSQVDYGVFSQFYVLYNAIYSIFAIGLHVNLFYFFPGSTKEQQDVYVTNTVLLLCVMSVLTIIILCIPIIQDYLFGDSLLNTCKVYVIGCIALAVPMNIVAPLYTVRQHKIGALFLPVILVVFRIVVVVVFAIFYNDLYFVFRGLFVYQIIVFILTLVYAFYNVRPILNLEIMKNQLVYALPFGFAVALQLFSNYFDKIISIKYLTETDYAIYSVAFLSIPFINQIYESLCQVNIVNMTKCYKGNEKERIVPLYKTFVSQVMSFSIPVILIVSLFSDEIIGFLYPSSYVEAALYFRIYSLSFLVSMLGAGTILRAVDKTQLSLNAFGLSCMIGLPATYFLVRGYGMNGAIIGALINILLPRIIQMSFEMKISAYSIRDFLPWRELITQFSIALLCLIPIFVIKTLLSPIFLFCVFLSGFYIVLVYILYMERDLFIVDKKLIQTYVKRFVD